MPLTWLHNIQRKYDIECFAFFIGSENDKYPNIESWFIACTENSPFIQDWYSHFFSSKHFDSTKEYVDKTLSEGIEFPDNKNKYYFSIYVSSQKLLQQNIHKYRLYLCDSMRGPFIMFKDSDGDHKKAIDLLTDEKTSEKYHKYPLIKLINDLRNKIQSRSQVEQDRVFS